MTTFLTDMMKKEYTQEEVFAVLFESEREKKRREMLAIVTKTGMLIVSRRGENSLHTKS